ncbi:MAG: helix-turn-helix domain-containing protein [Cycloclasticus sp.]
MSTAANNLFRELSVSCSNCSLGELCIPHGLNQQDIELLDDSVSHTKLLRAGDVLYRQHSPFESLYALKSGSVKITTLNQESNEDVMGVYLPGEIIGFDGLSEGQYQCSIQALETSNICEINLDKLQSSIPNIYKQLLKHASKAINDSNNNAATGKVSAEKRIVSFLLDLAERYRVGGYIFTEFNFFLSRTEMGNFLNLSPETVSRGIRKLERDKLITLQHQRRIKINDLDGLKSLLTTP